MRNRHTNQRQAIRTAFQLTDRPLGPKEILELAQQTIPALSLGTVYRNINQLLEEGFLTPVVLPGQPARYEKAGKDHHHHFHCRSCGGVFEIEGCPGHLRRLTPKGFKLETHDLLLGGLCPACA